MTDTDITYINEYNLLLLGQNYMNYYMLQTINNFFIVIINWINLTNFKFFFVAKNIFCYRDEKIKKLCNVMGVEMAHDPDETYELTTDNVKKILAIYMRFR